MVENEKTYITITTPVDAATRKFYLNSLEGEEDISKPFHYRLKLFSEDSEVVFKNLVGKKCTVTMEFGENERIINGIITGFRQGKTGVKTTAYDAEIRAWPWLLTMTEDCRIFQQKTVPEIIEEVLGEYDFAEFKNSLTSQYTSRDYCVQYGESVFNFISRLMEEEGIFYFFEHSSSGHEMVLADSAETIKDCPGLSEIKIREAEAPWEMEGSLENCGYEERVITNTYATADYNFEIPDTSLAVSVDGTKTGELKVYHYPGRYTELADGEALAKKRIEGREAPEKILTGQGYCRSFTAGYKFTLQNHQRSELNQAYALKQVSIKAGPEQYSNTFEAFPASTPFRPRFSAKKPKIYGSQTALVTGKDGEEIWTDEYGRIKVQFYWDQNGEKDENSSCWVRVAQAWAGKSFGALFTPRIGQEVVVSFLEGDPDRPLITGSVYNSKQTLPTTLPENQTQSAVKTNSSKGGEGYNEIVLEDKKDSEEIRIQAQKDMNETVKNDYTQKVLNDSTTTITQNRSTTIEKGNDSLKVSKGNRTVNVETGDESLTVAGKRDISVKGKETVDNKADYTQTVGGNYTLNVKGDLTIDVSGSVKIKAGSSMAMEAGTSLDAKAGTGLTNTAGTALTNKAGTNLTNKGGINLTNEAAVALTNKGVTVKDEGSAMVEIKGGIVKIN